MTSSEDNMKNYRIKKVFNNNVVLVNVDQTDKEFILTGKGLGFNKQVDDLIEVDDKIEKEFISIDKERREKYERLIEEVDEKVIGLTQEIVAMVKNNLAEELDQHINIALADHIGFYLKRIKQGLEVTNPFLAETKTLYKTEYKLAQKAAKMIRERFEVEVPEGEVGFITLHIHGARSERGVSKTVKYTKLIKNMVKIIETELEIDLSFESLNYARLVTHLRFALERIEQGESEDNLLLDKIKQEFKTSYQIAEKIAQLITDKTKLEVPEDEVGYLAMHIERLNKG